MNPISTVITWWLKRRMSEIDHIRNNPVETQALLWQKLMDTARDTEWGRQYKYHKITSIREFQEQVPTSRYEELFPWIEKAMKGGENLLWPGLTTSFSKSSGTTNDKHKYIPVTQDSLEECHYKGGKDLISLYLNNRENSEVLNGKNLAITVSPYHCTPPSNWSFAC